MRDRGCAISTWLAGIARPARPAPPPGCRSARSERRAPGCRRTPRGGSGDQVVAGLQVEAVERLADRLRCRSARAPGSGRPRRRASPRTASPRSSRPRQRQSTCPSTRVVSTPRASAPSDAASPLRRVAEVDRAAGDQAGPRRPVEPADPGEVLGLGAEPFCRPPRSPLALKPLRVQSVDDVAAVGHGRRPRRRRRRRSRARSSAGCAFSTPGRRAPRKTVGSWSSLSRPIGHQQQAGADVDLRPDQPVDVGELDRDLAPRLRRSAACSHSSSVLNSQRRSTCSRRRAIAAQQVELVRLGPTASPRRRVPAKLW